MSPLRALAILHITSETFLEVFVKCAVNDGMCSTCGDHQENAEFFGHGVWVTEHAEQPSDVVGESADCIHYHNSNQHFNNLRMRNYKESGIER